MSSSCRVYLDSVNNINSSLLSIQEIESKIGTINKYTTKSNSHYLATK
jgi:hypothetical protein